MEEIAPVAEAHSASPAQVVIAWTLEQPGITFALCGARNPSRRARMRGPAASVCRRAKST